MKIIRYLALGLGLFLLLCGCGKKAQVASTPLFVVQGDRLDLLNANTLTPRFILYSDGLILFRESTEKKLSQYYKLQLEETELHAFEQLVDAYFLSPDFDAESPPDAKDHEDYAIKLERVFPAGTVEALSLSSALNGIEWIGPKMVASETAANLPKALLILFARIRELECSVDRVPVTLGKDPKGNPIMPGVANRELIRLPSSALPIQRLSDESVARSSKQERQERAKVEAAEAFSKAGLNRHDWISSAAQNQPHSFFELIGEKPPELSPILLRKETSAASPKKEAAERVSAPPLH